MNINLKNLKLNVNVKANPYNNLYTINYINFKAQYILFAIK
jgi:hypothetical protein